MSVAQSLHFVLRPEHDGDLTAFMQRLTITHVRRWQEHRGEVGLGHVYQGRYQSFPIQTDEDFYHVARYVERNALRAVLAPSAEEWRWSSLWRRVHGSAEQVALLSGSPLPRPRNWKSLANQPQHECEIEAVRRGHHSAGSLGFGTWLFRGWGAFFSPRWLVSFAPVPTAITGPDVSGRSDWDGCQDDVAADDATA